MVYGIVIFCVFNSLEQILLSLHSYTAIKTAYYFMFLLLINDACILAGMQLEITSCIYLYCLVYGIVIFHVSNSSEQMLFSYYGQTANKTVYYFMLLLLFNVSSDLEHVEGIHLYFGSSQSIHEIVNVFAN